MDTTEKIAALLTELGHALFQVVTRNKTVIVLIKDLEHFQKTFFGVMLVLLFRRYLTDEFFFFINRCFFYCGSPKTYSIHDSKKVIKVDATVAVSISQTNLKRH